MKVRIYQPAKSAMQSGRSRTGSWVLEAELQTPRRPEGLMGWTGAGDTLGELVMKFSSAEAAMAFARKRGWEFSVAYPNERVAVPRNYVDNFRYRAPETLPRDAK